MPRPPDIAAELGKAEVESLRQTQLRELSKAYGNALQEIQLTLLSPDLTRFQRTFAMEKQVQVNAILRGLNETSSEWSDTVVPLSYERGLDVAERQIRRLDLGEQVNARGRIHTGAVNVLTTAVAKDLLVITVAMQQTSLGYIRRAQLSASQNRQLSRAISEGLIQGDTRTQTSDRILAILRSNIETGKMVRINGVNYDPAKYAELIARTRTREATTQATINAALEFGMDLIMVDTHDDPCPWCQQYSGRVYSISGEHPDFPALETRSPFHPNCECTMHPTTENHLRRSGDYDNLVVLSNDPTQKVKDNDAYDRILGREASDLSRAEKAVRKAQPLEAPKPAKKTTGA